MRSKFILYLGGAIVTLFGIGLGLLLLFQAVDDPFGLVMTSPRLPRVSGTTTTNLVRAAISIASIVALIAVVAVLVRRRLEPPCPTRPTTPVDESRDLLHTHAEQLRDIARNRRRHWKRSKKSLAPDRGDV